MNNWDFSVIPKYFTSFMPYAWMTVQVTVFGLLIGLVLGLGFALLRLSKLKILNYPAKAYIWAIRGTPLLLQLLFIYFGLVTIVVIDKIPAACIALGIHNGAYIAEIFRGSIQSVDRGQREAGLSLGMTSGKIMKNIILPQAFKRAVPPLGNQFIIALKDSSLASAISVGELLLHARQLGSSQYQLMEMLTIAAIYYLFMTTVLTVISNLVEKKLKVSDNKSTI
ncbi:MAG: amino acid ABC transporter permease [Clostridia bacterium]|jgi:polar amino acid transport system permease protein|nr:amino acid ABC transporter permease [Clostridia bacterium]